MSENGVSVSGRAAADLPDPAALRAMDAAVRAELIADHICALLREFLTIPPAHRPSRHRPLRSQGVGSITALKLRRVLESALEVEVPVVELLRDDTLEELAVLLAERLELAGPEPGAARATRTAAGSVGTGGLRP